MAHNNENDRAWKSRAYTLPTALLLCCALAACDDERGDKTKSDKCASGTLESDLDDSPWVGPGVDADSGELTLSAGKEYVVSSTYGVPVPGADGAPVTEKYVTLFGAIQEQLATQPGLLGLKLTTSSACGSGRTLAVWESEEAMYDFVLSPAHSAAMSAVDEVLKPGYGVTHWKTKSRAQVSFGYGAQQLAQEANGD